jgi:beta-fructofuranosidase
MRKPYMTTLLILILLLLAACKDDTVPERVVNHDFETGDLTGWTVSDGTEEDLVIDDVFFRDAQRYMPSGGYFFTTKGRSGDVIVESGSFELSGLGYVALLIGGPTDGEDVRIELVDGETDAVVSTVTNPYYDGVRITDSFVRVVLDLTEYLGRSLRFRLVDESEEAYLLVDHLDTLIETEEELQGYQDDVLARQGLKSTDLLASAEHYINLKKRDIDPSTRYTYHVMGEVGWINDPNGFVQFDDDYQLFYQHHPYSTMWGPMHWGHVRSDDLIKWEYLPVALAPHVDHAGGGAAFSGSAIDIDGTLYLMYTENWVGYQHQVLAKSTDGIHFEPVADGEAVIDAEDLPFYANPIDFRDPKIWEEDGVYYAVVGSRQINGFGQVLLFSSLDLKDWTYVGPLIQGSQQTIYTLGYMFECPDVFSLGDNDVLIMSPQEIPGHRNNHGTVYVVGNLNYDTGILEDWSLADIQEIDYGFDFYAPQTMVDDQGRRIMVAWMQSWNRSPMTGHYGWAGAMTIPRVLSLDEEGRLIQYPIEELLGYRTNPYELNETTTSHRLSKEGNILDIELSFVPEAGESGIVVYADDEGNGTRIYYDDGRLYLDRTNSVGGRYQIDMYNITSAPVTLNSDGSIDLRILLDRHSIEVFVNGGEAAITSTVYYHADRTGLILFADNPVEFTGTFYDIVVD